MDFKSFDSSTLSSTEPSKEEIKDREKEVKKYKAIATYASTEGGQFLIEDLQDKIASCVETLAFSHDELTETQLRTVCANLYAFVGLLRLMTNAESHGTLSEKELKKLLKQEE